MDILLTFMNESNASPGSRIVLFQKNTEASFSDNNVIAWRVLPVLEKNVRQRLHVSMRVSVAARDRQNTICEQHLTDGGKCWDVINTKNRDWMVLSGQVASQNRIEVRNSLPRETITAQIYKDGRLLAEQGGLEPRQTVGFSFEKTLWMGITSDNVEEGDTLHPEKLRFVTELPLEGYTKADLVLTNTGDEYKFRLIPVAEEVLHVSVR